MGSTTRTFSELDVGVFTAIQLICLSVTARLTAAAAGVMRDAGPPAV